jgi:dienelactone hydrolase
MRLFRNAPWMGILTFLCVFLAITSVSHAKIMGKLVTYADKGYPLEGYVAYDDSYDSLRPAILIFPQWTGISRYEQKRAEQLARMGYFVFVADMYGRGVRPSTPEKAQKLSKTFKDDRALMRRRANLALASLRRQKFVNTHQVVAMGYCFGGTVALELARSGATLRGVLSVHGNLDTPTPEDAKNIKYPVLIMHGADDPLVNWDTEVANFRAEMQAGQCDWRMIVYGGAVHAFTQGQAGNDPSTGVAYHRLSDARSFRDMERFFKEVLY